MSDAEILLAQIDEACRRLKMAHTTFGRQAVNDGKLVSRLQQGGRITLQTVHRVHSFIAQRGGDPASNLRSAIRAIDPAPSAVHNFRFYDNRQRYLMFVNTTSEKQLIADRALDQLRLSQPVPPAIRLFDGGAGDGSVLTRLLRGAHRRYPWLPFYVVAKEISVENVRLMLEKMPDRLQEHPATVLIVTNLNYADAPWLKPASPIAASAMAWEEVALDGSTAGDFEESIAALQPVLDKHWKVDVDSASGRPLHKTPAVLVIYRRDQRFVLDSIIPRRGSARADFDFALLSHPYRAKAPLAFKTRAIIAPVVRSLRPNGRLMGVQAHGENPGLDIVRAIWPNENPRLHGRRELMDALRSELGRRRDRYSFHDMSDAEAVFRYSIRMLPNEIKGEREIGVSTLLAAWNAASYVAQIEDTRLEEVLIKNRYMEATRNVLRTHSGLWFTNETYIISRRAELDALHLTTPKENEH
jgi:hypothetical protein